MDTLTQEKEVYIEKIKLAIKKLTAAKKSIQTGMKNPYIKGETPEEIFNYAIENLDNPTNNQDGGGKRRSTQKNKK